MFRIFIFFVKMGISTILCLCLFLFTFAAKGLATQEVLGRTYEIQRQVQAKATVTKSLFITNDGSTEIQKLNLECVKKCTREVACRAATAFMNGTCELVLEDMFTTEVNGQSTLYKGEYSCPYGYSHLHGFGTPTTGGAYIPSCYTHVSTGSTWEDALKACENLGGKLVSIESSAEQQHLKQVLNGLGQETIWTSGYDVTTFGNFAWATSSENMIFTSWFPPEPNNAWGSSKCVAMKKGYAFNWIDITCNNVFIPLCEASVSFFANT